MQLNETKDLVPFGAKEIKNAAAEKKRERGNIPLYTRKRVRPAKSSRQTF